MKLFLGNCTKKKQDFFYLSPNHSFRGVHERITIEPGKQVQFPGDHASAVFDKILNTPKRYGWIEASGINQKIPYVGLCYSFDKPVSESILNYVFEHNDGVLDEAAELEFVKTASAVKPLIGAQPYGEPQMKAMDVCIEDLPSDKDPNKVLTADLVEVGGRRPDDAPRRRRAG